MYVFWFINRYCKPDTKTDVANTISYFFINKKKKTFMLQVLSALDILQPPHLDFFQEMYPFYIFFGIINSL